jgi:hypothetical protein
MSLKEKVLDVCWVCIFLTSKVHKCKGGEGSRRVVEKGALGWLRSFKERIQPLSTHHHFFFRVKIVGLLQEELIPPPLPLNI